MSLNTGDQPAEDRLRDLEALTDRALAHLDVDELLSELLDRVGSILGADTAAILLRSGGDELVATAAHGLEAEVRQGVRIPLGKGFAGRIAAERRPVAIDRVDPTTVTNPILWERGIQSMLGVPLLAGGDLVGVIHVGTLTTRRFTTEDADLLQLAADRVALAARARLLEEERAAARALQRILLPAELPSIPSLEFAARYVPSTEIGVGGDWYDAFVLPSGRLCVVIGDVVGHGLRAATIMGRLRATFRANAFRGGYPDEILALVDRELQHFEPDEMATVLFAMFEPSIQRLQLSSAGHPAPVMATSDGARSFVDITTDPPLGVDPHFVRTAITLDLPPGGVLLFYTDGLVERREASLDVGLNKLLDTVVPADPNSVCATVMQSLVGDTSPPDDIALLAIRRTEHTEPGGVSGAGQGALIVGSREWMREVPSRQITAEPAGSGDSSKRAIIASHNTDTEAGGVVTKRVHP